MIIRAATNAVAALSLGSPNLLTRFSTIPSISANQLADWIHGGSVRCTVPIALAWRPVPPVLGTRRVNVALVI